MIGGFPSLRNRGLSPIIMWVVEAAVRVKWLKPHKNADNCHHEYEQAHAYQHTGKFLIGWQLRAKQNRSEKCLNDE